MAWFLFCVFFAQQSWSEYRVFELKITDTVTKESRRVLSTLDPWQYGHYYPIGPNEKLEWMDHWMCWRRKEPFAPLCERPGRELELKSESEDQTS